MKWLIFIGDFFRRILVTGNMNGNYPSLKKKLQISSDEDVITRVTEAQIFRDKNVNILCLAVFFDGQWKIVDFDNGIVGELQALLTEKKIFDNKKKSIINKAKSEYGKY